MPTRVLFFNPARILAPSWAVCAQILRHLDRERFEPRVVLDVDPMGTDNVPPDVPVLRRPFGDAMRRLSDRSVRGGLELTRHLATVAAWVRRERIDVIHANDDGRSMALAVALARLTGRRLVLHYHTVPRHFPPARRMVTRRAARLADLNVGVSRFIARELVAEGIPPSKVAFVVNGTDPRRFRPAPPDPGILQELGLGPEDLLVMQMARLWRPKRQEDVVRALALARRRDPRLKLLLVGWDDPRYEGPFDGYRDELQALAESLGVADAVFFQKARPDSPALHATCDLEVLASEDDPCPLVVVEAMAAERPVVGARSGGIPEMIDDGVTGRLVPPRSPEMIAQALLELAADPARRAALGRAARRRVLAFHQEARVARQFGSLYEVLAAGRPLPRELQLGPVTPPPARRSGLPGRRRPSIRSAPPSTPA